MIKIKNLFFILCFLFVASFILTSCKKPPKDSNTEDENPTTDITPTISETSWTLMIYLCGSDLESKNKEASLNITQMLQATLPDSVNVLIQTGGTKKWNTPLISSNYTNRYIIKDGKLELVDSIPEMQNFGDAKTLTDYISYGLKEYPAEHTGLILWNHGSGSLKGVCFDENYDFDGLTLPELGEAFKNAKLKKKLDFVGFDACMMSTFGVAYELAPYALSMIASTEKEPHGGWDYTALLNSISKEDFYDTILSSYALKSKRKDYYTLSCIDLTQMDALTSAMEKLIFEMEKSKPRTVVNSIAQAINYGGKTSDYYDLGYLFDFYEIPFDLSTMISYTSGSLHENGSGMSLYFPFLSSENLDLYMSVNPYKPYSDFLEKFYKDENTEKIHFVSYGEENEQRLSFTLDNKSLEYLGSVQYALFYPGDSSIEGEEDVFYALGMDCDYMQNQNQFTIDFTGRWVKFGGYWLYCSILDRYAGITTYASPILVNNNKAELIFVYQSNTGVINILGVIYDDEYGRLYDLEDGWVICVGERRMAEDSYEDLYINEFVYDSNSTRLTVEALPDGYYQYTAYVKDVFGKLYTAGSAVVQIENGIYKIILVTTDEAHYPDDK